MLKKLILIDGAGLIYRSFFALPPSLVDPEGQPTNAILGFTNILLNILTVHKPDYIAIALDKKGPTFRHKAYEAYKATRVKAPQALYDQIPKVKEVIEAFRIPLLEREGYEADDLIATCAKRLEGEKELEILVATGDFDLFQMVKPHVKILYPEKGFREAVIFGPKEVEEKYGIRPEQIPEYKGLAGDSSDNIPGVKGVGEKTAKDLLQKYGTLENIYKHLGELSEGLRKKLETDRENAFFSRELCRLVSDVEITFSLEGAETKTPDPQKTIHLFEAFGFKKLLERLRPMLSGEQKSLF